ncbi:MAG TPA: hypothetical protein VH643_16915 [Gemmataceae bacterium]
MTRRALQFLIVASLFIPGVGAARMDAPDNDGNQFDQKLLLKKVGEVVKKHYPKAKVELKDGVIRFDYKTRIFKIHTANLDGVWQDAHDERGPQPGGVCGWIQLLKGEYVGMAVLPQEFDVHYYKSYRMGHYERKLDCTVDAGLSYPPREGNEFVEEFEKVIDQFEKYVRKKEK